MDRGFGQLQGSSRIAAASMTTGSSPNASSINRPRAAVSIGNVRLKDIAKATGYSTNTVSLALRGSLRLPHATRERIRRVASELDYLPNKLAQALAGSKCYAIGLVLTDIQNPILTEVAQEVSSVLHNSGYSTLFATSNNRIDLEIEVIREFRARQADGILVFPVHHREVDHLVRLREHGYPIVSLAEVPEPTVDCVCLRERKGAFLAVEHLTGLGHRNIAILDAASPLGNFEKRDGYRDALRSAGIEFRPEMEFFVEGHGVLDGYQAMNRLRGRVSALTAVFATSDPVALGVQRWCQENSVGIPTQLSVMGFDDTEFSRLADPSLSTVRFPVREIVEAAVGHLCELVEREGDLPVPTRRQLEPELVARASTAAPG